MGNTPSTPPPQPPQGCPVDHQSESSDASKCPVKHDQPDAPSQCPVKHDQPDAPSQCPVKHDQSDAPSKCPVKHDQQDASGSLDTMLALAKGSPAIDDRNNMPAVAEQKAWPGQRYQLPTYRVKSEIPKAEFTPSHQPGATSEASNHSNETEDGEATWVYPSEQQFFNAMKRKGWQPHEEDMKIVVAIHNAVNDRTWQELMKWEALHPECDDPKLERFLGRPKDLSPKARFRSMIGYAKPFDRHDWYVDRCGKQVRYVVDFYRGNPTFFFLSRRRAHLDVHRRPPSVGLVRQRGGPCQDAVLQVEEEIPVGRGKATMRPGRSMEEACWRGDRWERRVGGGTDRPSLPNAI